MGVILIIVFYFFHGFHFFPIPFSPVGPSPDCSIFFYNIAGPDFLLPLMVPRNIFYAFGFFCPGVMMNTVHEEEL